MEQQTLFNTKLSLNRPSWTSMDSTGSFNAYKHKHSLQKGCFCLDVDYYTKTKGLVNKQ